METLYIKYEGKRPFIQATLTDKDDRVMWIACDTSIGNLIRDVKKLFRGYNIEVQLPGVKNEIA